MRLVSVFDIVIIEDIVKYMKNNNSVMQKKDFKIALALGSGGAKGLAHIGVLKALEEAGFKPDIITGSSMGAIIGSCYALGVDVSMLEKKATDLTTSDIYDLNFPNAYGFMKGNKAEKAIRTIMNTDGYDPVFSDCKIPFACVAADIARGELVKMKHGPLIPAVRASFSICGVFRPVEINGRKLLDGGIFCRVPVDLAREMGADFVIAVDCIGKTLPEDIDKYKYVDTISRIFSIMDYQVSRPEMERADALVSLYQPNVSAVRVKNIAEGIEIGYQTMKNSMDKILKMIEKSKQAKEGKRVWKKIQKK